MSSSAFPSVLAFQKETTQGTSPGSWGTNGKRLHHLYESLDPSNLKRAVVDDRRATDTIFGLPGPKLKGIRQSSFSFELYLHGTGVTTADGVQVSELAFMTLLENALGGMTRGRSTTLKTAGTHTATSVALTATTGVDEGVFLAFEDDDALGETHVRRVTALAGDVVTLDQALPFTPVDGDNVHAVADFFPKQSTLVYSNGAGGPFTMSWWIQKGLSGSDEVWECTGCKAELTGINFGRGDAAVLQFTIHVGHWKGPDELAEVSSWTIATAGEAPLVIGPDTKAWFQDKDATTTTNTHAVGVSFTPGVPVLPIETITEVQANMEGLGGYTTGKAETMVELDLVDSDSLSDLFDEHDANTYKVFRYAKVAAPGKGFALHLSKAEITEVPDRAVFDARSGVKVKLRAHEDDANSAAGDAELWRAKFHILLF